MKTRLLVTVTIFVGLEALLFAGLWLRNGEVIGLAQDEADSANDWTAGRVAQSFSFPTKRILPTWGLPGPGGPIKREWTDAR